MSNRDKKIPPESNIILEVSDVLKREKIVTNFLMKTVKGNRFIVVEDSGKHKFYACCPHCRTFVNIRKHHIPQSGQDSSLVQTAGVDRNDQEVDTVK
jgi:hypothetical protein